MSISEFEYKEIDVDKITTGVFQVRDKNPSKTLSH